MCRVDFPRRAGRHALAFILVMCAKMIKLDDTFINFDAVAYIDFSRTEGEGGMVADIYFIGLDEQHFKRFVGAHAESLRRMVEDGAVS